MNPTVITLCFLAFAIIMFVLEKIPLGLTATIVSVGLCVTGVLEPKQAFAGYATPIGMPANTMVVRIGGYKFIDYVKAGLPLILVSFIICMVILPVAYPFFPA